jgi:hypothetical protein
MTIQLTPEESKSLAEFNLACDARAAGYVEGMNAAKKLFLDRLILTKTQAVQKGTQNESVSQSVSSAATNWSAATQHAATEKQRDADDAPAGTGSRNSADGSSAYCAICCGPCTSAKSNSSRS